MRSLLGAEYGDFLASYEKPRNVGLRLNPRKHGPLAEYPLVAAIPWCPTGYYYEALARPGLHPHHEAGAYYLQEPSAMAPAGLLDPQPGERVLDLCAAPGGKATQLAAMMQGQGLLVANEIHGKRAKILARNLERMGVAHGLCLNETPKKLEEAFPGYFHRVLVDAPCSGEGMFRKEEAAVEDWAQETVEMCARRQLEVLHSAAVMTAPGGRLVYSTCTFSPEENEGVIMAFLGQHPEFSIEPVKAPCFAPGRPDWVGGPEALARTFRLWPHKLQGEGHFAAVLRKAHGQAIDSSACKGVRAPTALRNFIQEVGCSLPGGKLLEFAGSLCMVPEELPDLRGLKVLRVGLELGQIRGERLNPAHAWALWLAASEASADFPSASPEIGKYLRGESIPSPQKGWTLVQAGGLSLGWAKGSEGQLKNHFPKGLRWHSGNGV